MKLLYGHSNDVERFVASQVPNCPEGFGNCQAIGVVDKGGKLVAGWVWHDWNPSAEIMEFSGASITPRWMTRKILHQLFAYAFELVGCQMIVTRNSETNTRLHRQLTRFGFDRINIPRLFGRSENGVVWTLTEEQWKAGEFYVEAQSAHAA
jgi:RimJ/RimL family protein N-acetyltransferase|tara:strand:- start:7448 stop:7900 length:453 start_codon:yes stop_codon:yes gene_type:complete